MKNSIEKTPLKKRILPTFLAAFILPFIVFVATPAVVFSNNIDHFLFGWSDFIPLCILFALGSCAIFFFAVFFLPERAHRICIHILLGLGFLFFVQITYLNGSMSLAGDNMGGSPSLASVIINLIVWVLVFVGFIVLAILKDKKKYIKTGSFVLSIVIVLTQIVSTLTPIISNKKFFQSYLQRNGETSAVNYTTYKNFNRYSTTDNIYYFVIDRFDEKFAEEAVKIDPTFFNHLTGFTWFQDNIALYGHTFPALAYAMTGVEYSCELDRLDYFKSIYSQDNYLTELKDAGYDINLYTDSYYCFTTSTIPEYLSNNEKCIPSLKSKFDLAWRMCELGTFVGSPLILKTVFNNMSTSAFDELFKFTSTEGTDGYSTKNDNVVEHVEKIKFEETTNKQFNMIHVEGCHEASSDNPENKKSSWQLLNKSFKVVNKFINNLKEKGLYDEATIVITGDHSSPYNHFVDVFNERRTALFFKPSQTESEAEQPLAISKAKVEQKNIMPTIFESVGLTSAIATAKGDTSLFVTDTAERRHVWHIYVGNATECIYKITGAGNNFDNWHLVKKNTYNRNIMD